MEDNLNFTTPLFEKAEQFSKTTIELIRLKTLSAVANTFSGLFSRLLAILVFLVALLLANLGLALWLGEILGKTYLGFFAVASFYLILGFLLFGLLHNAIKRKISNIIISNNA